jgi:hypothetical protein
MMLRRQLLSARFKGWNTRREQWRFSQRLGARVVEQHLDHGADAAGAVPPHSTGRGSRRSARGPPGPGPSKIGPGTHPPTRRPDGSRTGRTPDRQGLAADRGPAPPLHAPPVVQPHSEHPRPPPRQRVLVYCERRTSPPVARPLRTPAARQHAAPATRSASPRTFTRVQQRHTPARQVQARLPRCPPRRSRAHNDNPPRLASDQMKTERNPAGSTRIGAAPAPPGAGRTGPHSAIPVTTNCTSAAPFLTSRHAASKPFQFFVR